MVPQSEFGNQRHYRKSVHRQAGFFPPPGLFAVAKDLAMWLVNAALRRRYSVWVGMLLVVVLGIVSYLRTPTDILPNLKVPVVVVFASYRGMPAPDMEQSVTSILERAFTRCDHLEHIESRSLLGIGII